MSLFAILGPVALVAGIAAMIIAIRGGVEAFLARDADGGDIAPYTEVVVVAYEPPRVVLVSPLPFEEP